MGKSKTKSRNKNRSDPAGRQIKAMNDPTMAAIREQHVLPVLRDLQSPVLNTRSGAARVITNLIEDRNTRKLLLKEQIVRILLEQTLTDSSLETRTDGWGILRNLALEEETDFCVHLYRQDILTAIEGITRTVTATIHSNEIAFQTLPRAQQDLVWKLSGSIVNLILSLSEVRIEIVEAISKSSTIIIFLFGLLSFQGIKPDEVEFEVYSCLMALTEDNVDLAQRIIDNQEWMECLSIARHVGSLNFVAAKGVLHNLYVLWPQLNTKEPSSDGDIVNSLISSMQKAYIPNNKADYNHSDEDADTDQVVKLALEIIASVATSLQERLEHSNNNEKEFEGFDDEIEPLDEDVDLENLEQVENGDDDEMNEDEIDADMEMIIGDDLEDETDVELSILKQLVQGVPIIIEIITQSAEPALENGPLHITRDRAISTLNNIAWTTSSIDFSAGHLKSLQKLWAALSQTIWNEVISPVLDSNTADIELASSITSLAWAVARSVKGVLKIKPDEQRKFMALYQASKKLHEQNSEENGAETTDEDAFQGLGVKCIGVLGSLAAEPCPIELNREIGIFFLTVLSSLPDTLPADAVEALNQIYDIYADRAYSFDGQVFWGDNFYKHLEDIRPKVKQMTKSIDKRKFVELRVRADEAYLNLDRFLAYKRKEKANKSDE